MKTLGLPMIWSALTIQFVWAVTMFLSDKPLLTAGTVDILALFRGERGAGVAVGLAVVAASVGVLTKRWHRLLPALFAPQLIMLMISAWSAAVCVASAQYADGTPRSVLFMLRDQIATISFGVFYVVGLVSYLDIKRARNGK